MAKRKSPKSKEATKVVEKSVKKRVRSKAEAPPAKPFEVPVWAAAAVFLITTLIFFGGNIFGDAYFWDDFRRYVFPTQTFAAKAFAEGEIPFWNPYTFGGMPFYADPQVGFWYPPNRLLSLFVTSEGLLPVKTLQLFIALHFFAAQLSMFFLGRHLKISSIGSMLAAVSFGFSLTLVTHTFHPMMIYHLAWFPLVFMFLRKGLIERSWKFPAIAGLIFGGTMLAGHPQTTLYEGLFLGIYVIWFLVSELRTGEIKNKPALAIYAAIAPFLLAAGLFMVQYLPSQVLASHSERDETKYEAASEEFKKDLKLEKATEGSLKFFGIFTAVAPNIYGKASPDYSEPNLPFYLNFKFTDVSGEGPIASPYKVETRDTNLSHFYWETAFYFGVIALVFGLFGAVRAFRTRLGAFLAVTAFIGFMLALGENGFLFYLIYKLPLFGTFRNPARFMFFVTIAMSLLAGIGFDEAWRRKGKQSLVAFLFIFGVVLLVSILATAGALPGVMSETRQENFFATSRLMQQFFNSPTEFSDFFSSRVSAAGGVALLFTLIAGAAFFGLQKTRINPIVIGGALVVFAFIDLSIAGGSFNKGPDNPMEAYNADESIVQTLRPDLPNDIFRVSMRRSGLPRYPGIEEDNFGQVREVMLLEGYNPLLLNRRKPPITREKGEDYAYDKFYDMTNTRYALGVNRERTSVTFYERSTQYPRAWLTASAVVVPTEKVSATMIENDYDYLQATVLERKPQRTLGGSVATGDYVKFLEYENNRFKCEVDVSQNSLVNFSEIWYPFRRAYVDGEPAELLRADYCFLAVEVSPDNHVIEIKYESSAFSTGLIFALISLVLGVGIIVVSVVTGKK